MTKRFFLLFFVLGLNAFETPKQVDKIQEAWLRYENEHYNEMVRLMDSYFTVDRDEVWYNETAPQFAAETIKTLLDRQWEANILSGSYQKDLKDILERCYYCRSYRGLILEKLLGQETDPAKKDVINQEYLTEVGDFPGLINFYMQHDSLTYYDAAKTALTKIPKSYQVKELEELFKIETDPNKKVILVKLATPKDYGSTLPLSMFMFKSSNASAF